MLTHGYPGATAPEGTHAKRGSRSDDAIAVAGTAAQGGGPRSSNDGGTRAEGVGRAVPL